MMRRLRIRMEGRESSLGELDAMLARRPGTNRLEVEIGFGKGRFLLARAAALPDATFVGIESAPLYWSLASRRAERHHLRNVVTICGDALYVLDACVEPGIADAVHVYFPDPWPKLRHHRRRLLDASTLDLVVGALRPGGSLFFATDHAAYGAAVTAVLERYPAIAVEAVVGPWPDGARTNYETKYQREGRPILRLIARRVAPGCGSPSLHPDGALDVVAR